MYIIWSDLFLIISEFLAELFVRLWIIKNDSLSKKLTIFLSNVFYNSNVLPFLYCKNDIVLYFSYIELPWHLVCGQSANQSIYFFLIFLRKHQLFHRLFQFVHLEKMSVLTTDPVRGRTGRSGEPCPLSVTEITQKVTNIFCKWHHTYLRRMGYLPNSKYFPLLDQLKYNVYGICYLHAAYRVQRTYLDHHNLDMLCSF